MERRILIHPQWNGFEFSPHGALSEQHVDLASEMGFAYERSVDFHKDFHTHDRLMFVFPRPGCRMEVRTRGPEERFRIQEGDVLLVPSGVVHDDEGVSAVYDTIALFPSNGMLERSIGGIGSSRKKVKEAITRPRKFKRTPEIGAHLRALFFESVFLRKRSSVETRKVAESILDACLRELLSSETSPARHGDDHGRDLDPDPINRAVSHLEAHLFSPLDLATLTRVAGLSTSTLLRHFKKRTGLTPISYLHNRRLEEALSLLRTSRYSVGDVSTLVGYTNLGAFSEAFKRKFGKPPSVFSG